MKFTPSVRHVCIFTCWNAIMYNLIAHAQEPTTTPKAVFVHETAGNLPHAYGAPFVPKYSTYVTFINAE